MLILSFLRYLKPYRPRLAVAIFCMFIVSALSAVNIMIMIPVLEALFERAPEIQSVELTGSASETTEPDEEEESLTSRLIPEGVREWFGETFAGPTAYVESVKADAKEWFESQDGYRILVVLCVFIVAVTLIKCTAEFISRYHLAFSFYNLTLTMREDLFRQVLSQDYLFFTKHSAGYLVSRINSDVTNIKNLLNKLLMDGVQQPLNLIVYSALLLILSPQLTMITLLILPPMGVMVYYFSKALRKNTRKSKKKNDEISSSITEALHNVRLVKAFGAEELEIGKYVEKRKALLRIMMRRRIAKFASSPIMEILGTVGSCGVVLVGGKMILDSGTFLGATMSPPEFLIYLYVISRFYRPVKSLSAATMRYQQTLVSAERITEVLGYQPQIIDGPDPIPLTQLEQGLEFRDVKLRYKDVAVLDGVSLEIPRGKTVAIVGRSGSGKTSLANLAARLIETTEGQVLIDGVDIRRYRLADLRAAVGFVTQQTILFDDTIANNITYCADDAKLDKEERRARLMSAARDANAEGFIEALDGGKGFKTRIGPSGARLSGGQSQRVAIARALYRQPQIMIFDEATSSLDTHAQAQVQEAINRVLHNRTSLVISHRLSTVRDADQIYVLDKGRVVERGTHGELMALRGHYYQLYVSEESDSRNGAPGDPRVETLESVQG